MSIQTWLTAATVAVLTTASGFVWQDRDSPPATVGGLGESVAGPSANGATTAGSGELARQDNETERNRFAAGSSQGSGQGEASAFSGRAAAESGGDPFGGGPGSGGNPFGGPAAPTAAGAGRSGGRAFGGGAAGGGASGGRPSAANAGARWDNYRNSLTLPSEDANNENLMKALAKPYTGQPLKETPLAEFLEILRNEYDIQCWLDLQSLEDEGIDPEMTLNWNIIPVRMQTMLELLLDGEDLAYRIKDGILIVTTEIGVVKNQQLRVYDCRNLYPDPEQWVPAVRLQASHASRPGSTNGGLFAVAPQIGSGSGGFRAVQESGSKGFAGGGAGIGGGTGIGAPAVVQETEPVSEIPHDNIQQLVYLIQATVDPLSWEDNGGPSGATIHTFRSKLIIRNTVPVHSDVSSLLEDLAANEIEEAGESADELPTR